MNYRSQIREIAERTITDLQGKLQAQTELQHKRISLDYILQHYELEFVFTTLAGIPLDTYRYAIKQIQSDINSGTLSHYYEVSQFYFECRKRGFIQRRFLNAKQRYNMTTTEFETMLQNIKPQSDLLY